MKISSKNILLGITVLVVISLVGLSIGLDSCKKEEPPQPINSYFRAEIDGVEYDFEIYNSVDFNYSSYYPNSIEWIMAKGTIGDFIVTIHNSYNKPYTYQFDTTSWDNGICINTETCHEKFQVYYRPHDVMANLCNTTNPYSTSANIQFLTQYGHYPKVDIFPSFYFERSDAEVIKASFNGSLVHVCSMDSVTANFVNITNLSFELYRGEFKY